MTLQKKGGGKDKMSMMKVLSFFCIATLVMAEPGFNTPEEREAIRVILRDARGSDMFEPILHLVHSTINSPLMDGLRLAVPEELKNSPLAQWGFVDVTAPPFLADPTGKADSTAALQRAMDFACARQMVCYFPSGEYLVSDTLRARNGLYLHQDPRDWGALFNVKMPSVLVGSTRDPGKRAVIKLAENSSGFDNPAKPKMVVEFFSVDGAPLPKTQNIDVNRRRENTSYNQLFANIDIEIAPGNPGAAGLNMRAAEGASIQSVRINAGDGYCGFYELPASGGSSVDLAVIGGRYGIATFVDEPKGGTQPVPTVTGLTLRGQQEAAIKASPRSSLVLVGAHIQTDVDGPAVLMRNIPDPNNFNGQLVMVDSIIERGTRGSKAPLISTGRSAMLKNVYTRFAETIVNELAVPVTGADGWTRLDLLATSIPFLNPRGGEWPPPHNEMKEPILINREDQGTVLINAVAAGAPPADLCSRHVWPADYKHWDSPGVVNVREAPYFVKGDGIADDTAALQKAIDENEAIFLPKGLYNISRTLTLRPDTKMIGAAMHLSIIYSREPGDYFYSETEARPLVQTADDADAETVIAFMGFRINCERPEEKDPQTTLHYAVKWMCGDKSIWRFNYVLPQMIVEYEPGKKYNAAWLEHPAVLVSGNGGGRWYNFFYENFWPGHPYQRLCGELLPKAPFIKISGAGGNNRFYHFLLQHMKGDNRYHIEVENAAAVSIHGIKVEPFANFLKATNTDRVEIHGFGGGLNRWYPDIAMMLFEDCREVMVTSYADQVGKTALMQYPNIVDRFKGKETVMDWRLRPLVYWRQPENK